MTEHWTEERVTTEWLARGLSRRRLMGLLASGGTAAAALALSASAPGASAAAAAMAQDATPGAAAGGQVSVLWSQPVTLSPLFSSSGNEQQVERLMFGALVKMNDELLPVPDLAERVDVSDDVSVYTFHLHPGITFTDGAPLTSADVIFTFERAINGATGSIWQGRLLGIEGAEAYSTGDADSISGLNAPDDQTVEITLAEPDAAFLVSLCGFSGLGILPAHVLGDVPPDQLQEHPFSLAPDVTAGPFKFVRYETDQFLELERNPEYFGDAPPLDRIFLRILTPEVGQAQLETGEINLMALPVSEVERVGELDGLRVESVPSPSLDFLAINLERPYLQSPELRQAMIHAIDREGIARQVFQGEATVMNSTIFGPEWMGIPDGLEPYPYDPELAKELLAQSGYDPNQTIEIMHIPGTREKDAAVAIMLEQWRTVGIPAEILQVEVTELIRRYVEETDFDVLYNGGGVFRADPSISNNYFLTRNFTPNGGNGSHYSNPRIDELFIEGQATKDLEERQRIYTEIAQILNAELPWIYLWSPNSIYGMTDDLQGFVPPSYTDNKLWNAETWSISS